MRDYIEEYETHIVHIVELETITTTSKEKPIALEYAENIKNIYI